jgi:IS30 family transposase
LAAKLQREQQRLGSSALAKEELSIYSQEQLNAIADEVNGRPRNLERFRA